MWQMKISMTVGELGKMDPEIVDAGNPELGGLLGEGCGVSFPHPLPHFQLRTGGKQPHPSISIPDLSTSSHGWWYEKELFWS